MKHLISWVEFMKKIMIIGFGGPGISTLARLLGEKIKIEVFQLDTVLSKLNRNPGSR